MFYAGFITLTHSAVVLALLCLKARMSAGAVFSVMFVQRATGNQCTALSVLNFLWRNRKFHNKFFRFQLILLEDTAMGIRLRHASLRVQTMMDSGGRLSNTWVIYPREGINLGKLRIMPHRQLILESFVAQTQALHVVLAPEDEPASE